MKKKLTALLLACFMLATLAACGGTSETESPAPAESGSPEESGSPAEVIEITIPSYKTGENVGAVFFEPQVERFNELYEGQYHITLESVPQDGFNDRLKQLAQQDMLPVLVQGGDVDWMANIAFPNGMAYDLSTWLDETPAVKDLLIDDGLAYCTNEDGTIYSLPLATVRPTGFFYNSALWNPSEDLSALSMDEFIELIDGQQIAFSTAENGWVAALFLTALIAAEDGGVEWLQSGVEAKITDFNNDIFINAVTKLQSLLQNNAASNSIGAAYADAANAFMSNQASIISNGPWMSADFAETNSANWSNGFNGADVRASLFPGQVGIATTSCFGEWWISASASEEEIELALAFLEFVYSPAELEAYLLAEGGDAPKLDYSEEFQAQQGETQVLADLAADTTEDTVFVPCILDMIPASVANSDFGRLLPSLADGTYSPAEFAEWMTDAAVAATAE
ncbi:MAG TPA: carbohydrate ABC transporter substrate-binding protein [Candidatus Scatomorpha intestinavium]|uniref:Carbohydrate ABC transporter substrate-binding protein n=1 Tax=Candidatus Scatomorpha intestinavium TaxID=2840922 RepID=A0A9D1CSX3_9FIRM|nr:carbohydrate ABC transporter substrate-binding protein [Candidatus Scatomorpha intestinavium]